LQRGRPVRILILGGAGFIGPRVVRALAGHDVTVFHRGPAGSVPGGVRHLRGTREEIAAHRPAFLALRPDVVLDLLPRNGPDAVRVIEAVRGAAPRLVAVSSGSVYRSFGVLVGSEPGAVDNTPSREDSPLRSALFPYRGRTSPRTAAGGPGLDDYDKIPAERAFLGTPELGCSIVRLPMVYGPGDPDDRVGAYLRPMADGRPCIVLQETAAAWRNARAFVDDAAAGIARVVAAGAPGRAYNVAEPGDAPEAEWIRRIGRAAGWRGEVVTVPDDGGRAGRPAVSELPDGSNFAQHLAMDTARIRAELGYREVVAPEAALRAAMEGVAERAGVADDRPGDALAAWHRGA
jgi:nucleoside-diphosphate-sugar epimerase